MHNESMDNRFVTTTNNNLDESKQTVDPNDTCTSDFYQVPITGGVPVKLTIENQRRPFTPPFAQLVKVQNNKQQAQGTPAQNKQIPEFIIPAG